MARSTIQRTTETQGFVWDDSTPRVRPKNLPLELLHRKIRSIFSSSHAETTDSVLPPIRPCLRGYFYWIFFFDRTAPSWLASGEEHDGESKPR